MNRFADAERFRILFRAAHPDVLRFVLRRTSPDLAEDVVAETFLVAWRRVADLPVALDDARAWLFGIARNQLLNAHWGARRQDALAVRLAGAAALGGGVTPDAADAAVGRLDVAQAWHPLPAADQEVLALTVFEQLTSGQAAAVLGISPGRVPRPPVPRPSRVAPPPRRRPGQPTPGGDPPMNTTHVPLDDVLRGMDAAPATLTADQSARADALLDSLVAADTSATVLPLRPRSRVARWLVPAAAASVLAGAAFVSPWNPFVTKAYADWTAEPSPVPAALAEKVADNCRSMLGYGGTVQVAEQRGGHVFVALRGEDGTAECLADADTGKVGGGTGGKGAEGPPLGPREAEVNGVGVQSGSGGSYGFTRGRVGGEVASVAIRTEGRTITATLANGEYVAWWPLNRTVSSEPAGLDMRVDVTLADRTVLHDHHSRPEMRLPGPTELGRVSVGVGAGSGGPFGFAEGLVGSRVVGVTVHSEGGDTVAQVRDDMFVAEWPAAEPVAGEFPDVRFSVTLDDGTVLADVVPVNG